MQIDISKLPYKHRFAASSMLMSKGNRLVDLRSLATRVSEKNRDRIRQGLSFYDMALSLMKQHDPNYQTLLNWKCQALISIEQFEDARNWYEELVRISAEAEGPDCPNPTARLAIQQIALLTGKTNTILPAYDKLDVEMFDDPPFCTWAEQFCWLLRDKKYQRAHQCLTKQLQKSMDLPKLEKRWLSMIGSSDSDIDISLETFEFGSRENSMIQVGWCYFIVVSDHISEAISMDVYKTEANAFEIGSLEFGRP